MCGIFFSCSQQTAVAPRATTCEYLKRRGPDSSNTIYRELRFSVPADTDSPELKASLTFSASVLSLRGNTIIEQPLEDPRTGSILCWNGEAWKFDDIICTGNDAQLVFDLLLQAIKPNTSKSFDKQTMHGVINALRKISGPSAFVFYDASNQRIFYGRDRLGRRSLLQRVESNGDIFVSSVCHPSVSEAWTEVKAGWICVLDLAKYKRQGLKRADTIEHRESIDDPLEKPEQEQFGEALLAGLSILEPSMPHFNRDSFWSPPPRLDLQSTGITSLSQKLLSSLCLRVNNMPSLPRTTPTPPQIAILFSGGLDCTVVARLIHDIIPLEQEVDLINVAFENPRVLKSLNTGNSHTISPLPSAFSTCPDRITGLSSYTELLRICPGRLWRFVSVDIPYSETLQHRPQIISLIHPHNTEMDLSIACALYFAARGSGRVNGRGTGCTHSYVTPARVLLSGLGADELFAGYRRHAIAFDHRGYQGLIDELELDFNRLGERNLGRDDRVISHWGREVRYPYLDDDLVNWALGLPVVEKCGFGQTPPTGAELTHNGDPDIEPGKKLLRLLAWELGLKAAAIEKKRAIQFGARAAKMEKGQVKGHQLIA